MHTKHHHSGVAAFLISLFILFMLVSCAGHAGAGWTRPDMEWGVHDIDRPQPPVIRPGTSSTQEEPGSIPSDAMILYRDAEDISKWESTGGGPVKWRATDDYMEVMKGAGSIRTKQGFGSCQLHVEWAAPVPAEGKGQDRGNSGVFLMSMYEVQVLDSYNNTTYPDGMAASLYGQYPPQVNACRPPGQWQTYDIFFHRPHFDEAGNVVKPATVTVVHNGVLVQDHVTLTGPTGHKARPPYKAHPAELPIQLQDHSHPVRFRNIWIRELPAGE